LILFGLIEPFGIPGPSADPAHFEREHPGNADRAARSEKEVPDPRGVVAQQEGIADVATPPERLGAVARLDRPVVQTERCVTVIDGPERIGAEPERTVDLVADSFGD